MRQGSELLDAALSHTGGTFAGDEVRLGIARSGVLDFAGEDRQLSKQSWKLVGQALESGQPVEAARDDDGQIVVVPLRIGEAVAGLLIVDRPGRPFATTDRWMMDLLASRLAVAVENTRLYRHLNGLFQQFMPADVATELVADPDQAALGGTIREVSVLFADLRGFTSFSERAGPEAVVAMLNEYFGVAAPAVIKHGGTVTTFIGDALMALYNAPSLQEDHALRAARAALALQEEVAAIIPDADAPRFRVGVNTGPALVGNIGSEQRRTYTAIGDAVNVASRLEGKAEPGEVVIGAATHDAIRDIAEARSLGMVNVKGKEQPVEAFVLRGLRAPRIDRGTQVIPRSLLEGR